MHHLALHDWVPLPPPLHVHDEVSHRRQFNLQQNETLTDFRFGNIAQQATCTSTTHASVNPPPPEIRLLMTTPPAASPPECSVSNAPAPAPALASAEAHTCNFHHANRNTATKTGLEITHQAAHVVVREAARAVQLKQWAQDGSRTAAVPDAVVVGAQEMAGGAGGGGEAGVKGLRKTLRHMSQAK